MTIGKSSNIFIREIGFLQRLAEEMPVAIGIAVFDRETASVPVNGRIVYYNRRWREWFGFGPEDVTTVADALERLYPDPLYREELLLKRNAMIRDAMDKSGPSDPFEVRIRTVDGKNRTFLTGTTLLEDRMVVSMEDVTRLEEVDKEAIITLYRSGSEHRPIALESIAAVVADGKYSKVLSGTTLIPDHRSIGLWEKLLEGGGFERIDRSTLARIGWIHAMQSIGRGGRVSFAHAAVSLDVGRVGRERILRMLFDRDVKKT